MEHDSEEFVADAFDADGGEGVGLGAEGVPCEGIDGVVEGSGEADGAEEAEPVFGEAEGRVADGAERVVFEVVAAADEVDEVTGERVEEHAIDGEVAALGVGFRGGEDDVVRAAAVEVGAVGAERGDFEEVAVEVDDDDAEVSADELGAGEELEDLVRGGAGGDVVVVGLAAEEFVADAAAGEVGGVACVGEPPGEVGGGGAEAQRVGCGVHGGTLAQGWRRARRQLGAAGGGSAFEEAEHEFAFGGGLAVDGAAAAGDADVAFHLEDFCFDEEHVAGDDGAAEFDIVGAHEVADFALIFGFSEHEDAGDLGHGFDLEDARHDWVAWEVALEERFVDGDGFDAGAFVFAFEADDAVDHEEGVAVGEDAHDLVDVEDGFSEGDGDRARDHAEHASVFGLEAAGHFCVRAVAGFDGDDVAHDAAAEEHEVADDVEDFVADEFVREAERFLGHDAVVADDDGVFETAALDEAFFEEPFDVLVEDEGACGGDFLFVDGGGDLGGEVLRVAAVWADLGAGDAEFAVWDDGDETTAGGFDVDGFADFVDRAESVLFLDAGGFDALDVGGGGAVADGRLVGVHFDEGVVDAHACEGGDDMLDGMDLDGAFCESGGAFDHLDLFDAGGDEGLVLEVHATEFDSVAGRGGLHGEGDLGTGVEGGACEGGWFGQRLLVIHDGGAVAGGVDGRHRWGEVKPRVGRSVPCGDADGEGGAVVRGGFDEDAAAVEVDAAFGDDEAEAGAGEVADIAAAVEGFEETGEVGVGDADALVGDGEDGHGAFAVSGDEDGGAWWGVFDGVVEEIGEDVAEEGFVGGCA